MERSVDSIGTCSLDVDTSADISDFSEISSVGTLRSASITPIAEPHLPSYLSLACTVNGYSTTTNYDPVRLARSRDASPHRIEADLTKNHPTYSVQNNLLSPPNLVPLPTHKSSGAKSKTMTENTLTHHHHQEFYSSKSTRYSNIFSSDTIDACLENGHPTFQTSKCVSFESKTITNINGQTKTTSESVRQEFTNGQSKSFIQQRVERLYGPGALAQGFFVSRRLKNRLSESETEREPERTDTGKHSKSMQDQILLDDDLEPSMKQSSSSPTLPVLRHLRPEFRAQLPIISPRKEVSMPKSITVPKLKDEVKVNGHTENGDAKISLAALKDVCVKEVEKPAPAVSGEKNGHYFLQILEEQTTRLLGLAEKTEKELSTPDLPEEIVGKIRSAAGKAKLLVSQKMQQFRGLCTNNINQSEGDAFPTTNEDLEGFWDMVMLQVNQVDALFNELNALKQNNWKEIKEKNNKPVASNSTTRTTTRKTISRPNINEDARKQRELERKKMIEEKRRAMKAQQGQRDIEIFVPESS
ncbi:uncharacterized protein LOC109599490 [Aethina tumida]|uniref:uncharacterized protein LOC109599490 n=1 Tax=Aethina tumida TaxID=116153 RepID=UPI002147DA75|nr:uncharacterized protein LOC109599490 [Aethina tumida]